MLAGAADHAADLHAILGDAKVRKLMQRAAPHLRIAAAFEFQEQPPGVVGPQDSPPDLQDPRIDLAAVVERTDGDVAVGDRRRRRGVRGVFGRAIAEKAVRQIHRFLAMELVRIRRFGQAVGKAIVDRLHARRIGVAQPRDLNGGRGAGEDGQKVVAGVAGQVDQDVYAILANRAGDGSVAHAAEVPVRVELPSQPLGDRIGERHVAVSENLHRPAVVAVQKGLEERRHRMRAEIRRHIADAQPSLAVAIVVVACPRRSRRRVGSRPSPVFVEDLSSVDLGKIVKAHQQIGADARPPRRQTCGVAQQADGLGWATHPWQRARQRAPELRVGRLDLHRLLLIRHRFGNPPRARADIAQPHAGGAVGTVGEEHLVPLLRLAVLLDAVQRLGQGEHRLRVGRAGGSHRGDHLAGLIRVAHSHQGVYLRFAGRVAGGRVRQGLPRRIQRLGRTADG